MNSNKLQLALSYQRTSRYIVSCNNNAKLAKILYTLNSYLSVSIFRIIGIFEVTFRNSIDNLYIKEHGNNWLRDAVNDGGMFDIDRCLSSKNVVLNLIDKLEKEQSRSAKRNVKSIKHCDLVSKLEFGFWKYQFAQPQFNAGGNILLRIFKNKPSSTKEIKYNQKYFYEHLDTLNRLRNRIAHHEPLCFRCNKSIIDINEALENVQKIYTLTGYLGYDKNELYGECKDLDYVIRKIMQLQKIVSNDKTK
ncbi:MAG: Abi family protein [Rikenellaceae bacterium]